MKQKNQAEPQIDLYSKPFPRRGKDRKPHLEQL